MAIVSFLSLWIKSVEYIGLIGKGTDACVIITNVHTYAAKSNRILESECVLVLHERDQWSAHNSYMLHGVKLRVITVRPMSTLKVSLGYFPNIEIETE